MVMGKPEDDFWGREDGTGETLNRKLKVLVEGDGSVTVKKAPQPQKAGRPPANATAEERAHLSRIFTYLKGKDNLVKKAQYAESVLNGEYGIKNELLAKLMLGDLEFRAILEDKRDVVTPLLELLPESNVDLRVKVAKALGEKGDRRALPALCNGLKEEEYWARYEFASALVEFCKNLKEVEAIAEVKAALISHVKGKQELSGQLRLVEHELESRVAAQKKDDDKKPAPKPPARTEEKRAEARPQLAAQSAASGRKNRPDTTIQMFTKGK